MSATCGDCVDTKEGNRLIKAGLTGSFYAAAQPNCAASVLGTLAPCSTVWYTGRKQAIDCDGTNKCYAQIQLTPGGGGPNYWLFRCTATTTANNIVGGWRPMQPLLACLPLLAIDLQVDHASLCPCSHNCLEKPTIVDTDYNNCGGGMGTFCCGDAALRRTGCWKLECRPPGDLLSHLRQTGVKPSSQLLPRLNPR